MLKQVVKRLLRNSVHKLTGVAELRQRLEDLQRRLDEVLQPAHWGRVLHEVAGANRGVQQLLSRSYRDSQGRNLPRPDLAETELRCFSQNGEDGILLYLFSLLGTTNKKVVEVCAGNGIECNAANLIVNHGWSGLLVDGDPANIAAGRRFYQSCRDTFACPPTLVHAWVTAENVNTLVSANGFDGDIDLLSLDLDGMDYWVWKALTCSRPRVVVLEFNYRWGPRRAVTVPYRPDFRVEGHKHPWCCGASLPAFVKLGRERGYRLVGTHRLDFNALFLRSDTGPDLFPEVSAEEVFARNPLLRRWTPDVLPSRAERPDYWDVVVV
jgi:hypothetical protein